MLLFKIICWIVERHFITYFKIECLLWHGDTYVCVYFFFSCGECTGSRWEHSTKVLRGNDLDACLAKAPGNFRKPDANLACSKYTWNVS